MSDVNRSKHIASRPLRLLACWPVMLQFIEKYQGDWLPPDTVPPHGTRNVDFVLWTGDGHPPDERVEGSADGQVRAFFPH